jgi:hypothetical protein
MEHVMTYLATDLKKLTAETHADDTGSIKIGGAELWLNAWLKDSPKGKYMSLSVKPKRDVQPAQSSQPSARRDMDDDIPF